MAVTLRSRQAVKLGAQTRKAAAATAAGGPKEKNKKKPQEAAAGGKRKQLSTRNAGVAKKRNQPRRRSGRGVASASLANAVFGKTAVGEEGTSSLTPTKLDLTSQTLSLARGSTPLRVYSPRRQSQLKSPAKSASKRAGRKATTEVAQKKKQSKPATQSSRSPKPARKKVLINVSQSSQEDTTAAHADPQYNRYVNDMKAYFADVDAYELQEDS